MFKKIKFHIRLFFDSPIIAWLVWLIFVILLERYFVFSIKLSFINPSTALYFYSALFQGNAALLAVLAALAIFRDRKKENNKTKNVDIDLIPALSSIELLLIGPIILLPFSNLIHNLPLVEMYFFLSFIIFEIQLIGHFYSFVTQTFYRPHEYTK